MLFRATLWSLTSASICLGVALMSSNAFSRLASDISVLPKRDVHLEMLASLTACLRQRSATDTPASWSFGTPQWEGPLPLHTVKRLWRLVFFRFGEAFPDVFEDCGTISGITGVRGREKRGHVLRYVRHHPEELRAYCMAVRA